MRVTRVSMVALLFSAAVGCDSIKSLYKKHTSDDLIVGSWRLVSDDGSSFSETMTFEGDGTFRTKIVDPNLGEDMTKLARIMEKVPARYSRGEDVIVISYDAKALRKATAVSVRRIA